MQNIKTKALLKGHNVWGGVKFYFRIGLPKPISLYHRNLNVNKLFSIDWLIDFWCLMPLSAILQLYHGNQFYWWRKPEYPERTSDPGQATGKLYHLRLRVECTLL